MPKLLVEVELFFWGAMCHTSKINIPATEKLPTIAVYGGFLKWWYPKMDGEHHGKPY